MKLFFFVLLIAVLVCNNGNAQGTIGCGSQVPPSFNDTAWTNYFTINSEFAIGTVEAPNDVAGTGVVGIVDLTNISMFPVNTNATPPMYFGPPGNHWTSQQLGQVFGVTTDAFGNIYVTPTSAYWNDNFGPGGSGAIYQIANGTGTVSVFSAIPNQNNTGIGNIAYDCKFNQFFVTNMEDGIIYRIDAGGAILSTFDPYLADDGTTPFPPLGERVWGVGVFQDRVYYSVWWADAGHNATGLQNEIRSVALNATGDFSTQDQQEILLPYLGNAGYSNPVASISFSPTGKMLLAERSMNDASFPSAHESRLLEYVFVSGQWQPSSSQFTIGVLSGTNASGGGDYGMTGKVWATGDALIFGTPGFVYGLQGLPDTGGSTLTSHLVDMWGDTINQFKTNIGAVRVVGGRGLGSISGRKWLDLNGDCTQDLPNELGLPNWRIELYPGPLVTYTDSMGNYSFQNLTAGQYTVVESLQTNWINSCPVGQPMYQLSLNSGQNVTDVNFANRAMNSVQDLRISVGGGIARLGQQKHLAVLYENVGTIPVNATVTFIHPDHTTYQYSNPSDNGYVSATRTLTYNVGVLPPGFSGLIQVYCLVDTPPGVNVNQQIHSSGTIDPVIGDVNPSDNADSESQWVRAAHDPNEKLVDPVGIGSFGGVDINTEFTYQINFQNNGNDTAFNIIVRDTIPSSLDISTFIQGASSHTCFASLQPPNKIYFSFPNILLPDSASHEPESHGWVKFKIKPFSATPLGTDINNRVGIYFDYNEVVLTNYTQNRIVDTSAYLTMYRSFPPESLVAKRGAKTIKAIKRGAGLPNAANLLDEVVVQGGFRPNASESDSAGGMRVGISFMVNKGNNKWATNKGAEREYSWVRLTKWDFKKNKGSGSTDIQTALEDKTGMHTGNARGFDSLFKNGVPNKRMLGQKTKLPPKDHNNHLFAELVALKVNIASSQMEKTPLGFGELVYDEENPLDELSVKEISMKADSALTFWNSANWDYELLDSVISKINRAFDGGIDREDTLSFISGTKLYLKGETLLLDVPYLKPSGELPSFMMPYHDVTDEYESDGSQPSRFELQQNYPNPFNPSTNFGFRIANFGLVTLKIYNMLGQEVAALLNNAEMEAGEYQMSFSAKGGSASGGNAFDLPSGVYFYRINVESVDEDGVKQTFTDVKRMLMMK